MLWTWFARPRLNLQPPFADHSWGQMLTECLTKSVKWDKAGELIRNFAFGPLPLGPASVLCPRPLSFLASSLSFCHPLASW